MEEEAASRSSVAELAGRFRGSAPPQDGAVSAAGAPVRRRPRSLQLPRTHGDNQEPPAVPSALSAKTKRNSALIEKLQASLALSPSAQLTSPKSPAFRLPPFTFPTPSPGSAPVAAVTPTSPVVPSPGPEEEGPVSFEAPPIVEEGSTLSSIIKSRARHSIRRRPPSRRHRKSSSGDEVKVAEDIAAGEDVFKTDDKADVSMCPETKLSHEDNPSKTREEDEGEEPGNGRMEGDEGEEPGNGRMEGDEGDRSSSGREKEDAEEKGSEQRHKDVTEEEEEEEAAAP